MLVQHVKCRMFTYVPQTKQRTTEHRCQVSHIVLNKWLWPDVLNLEMSEFLN